MPTEQEVARRGGASSQPAAGGAVSIGTSAAESLQELYLRHVLRAQRDLYAKSLPVVAVANDSTDTRTEASQPFGGVGIVMTGVSICAFARLSGPGWPTGDSAVVVRADAQGFGKTQKEQSRAAAKKQMFAFTRAAMLVTPAPGPRPVPPLATILLAAKTEEDVDAAFDRIFDLVAEAQERNALLECDRLLEWLARPHIAGALHIGVLLACLRLTAILRASLPHWQAARDAVQGVLVARNEDVRSLLCGLQG